MLIIYIFPHFLLFFLHRCANLKLKQKSNLLFTCACFVFNNRRIYNLFLNVNLSNAYITGIQQRLQEIDQRRGVIRTGENAVLPAIATVGKDVRHACVAQWVSGERGGEIGAVS